MAIVLLVMSAVVAVALMDRVRRSGTTARWSFAHLTARMLCDSTAEAAYLEVERQANVPGTAVFDALRSGAEGTELAGVAAPALDHLRADIVFATNPGSAPPRVSCRAILRAVRAEPEDPLERTGTLEVAARVELSTPGGPLVAESVRVARSFRVADVLPPRPLRDLSLCVMETRREDLARFRGRSALARASGAPRTLFEMMTSRGAAGFHPPRGRDAAALSAALARLAPSELARRAHFVVGEPEELMLFILRHVALGGGLSGVVHVTSLRPAMVDLSGFRGRCLLSFSGPVTVGRVTLADPARDSLTVVSPGGITVDGDQVQSCLVDTSGGTAPVVFSRATRVEGVVVSARFPRRAGIGADELGECAFTSHPLGESRACDPGTHVAAFAPYPAVVEHGGGGS